MSEENLLELGYNPQVLFWIAYYSDNTCLPQFDPDDGHENLWRDVDHSKLTAVEWHRFTPSLVEKLKSRNVVARCNPFLNSYKVTLAPADRVVCKREQTLKYGMGAGGAPLVRDRSTVYILGKEGGPVMRIGQDGSVELM